MQAEIHIPTVKAYFQKLTSARIRTAGIVWRIRENAFSETYIRKSSIARNALRFSPAGLIPPLNRNVGRDWSRENGRLFQNGTTVSGNGIRLFL